MPVGARAVHWLERYLAEVRPRLSLDTTAIYTEVSIRQLQDVHSRCHPSARLPEAIVPLETPPAGG